MDSWQSNCAGLKQLDDGRIKFACPLNPDHVVVGRPLGRIYHLLCLGDCPTDQVLSALGLTQSDLTIGPSPSPQERPAIEHRTPQESFSSNGAPHGPSNGKTRAFGSWQVEAMYVVKGALDDIAEDQRAGLASTKPEILIGTIVQQAKELIAEKKRPLWPLPELNESEVDEELHRLAERAVKVFRDAYLPAVAEQRQVSVYEDIQPALTALRVYEADEFFEATADLENIVWRWDRIAPSVGIVGVFGDPEAGKSTFLRTNALCMEQGASCLGRDCTQSKVLYLDLANEQLSHRRAFAKLGWKRGNLKIISTDSLIGLPNGLELVDTAIRQIGAQVVVVDMMADLLRFKDLNDYADAKRALRGVRLLSQQTSTLIYVLHHTPKALGPDADVLKAGLGSQAIVGAFDLRIAIRRRAKNLSTLVMSNGKLGGEPLTEEIVLVRDPETEWITLGSTWAKHRSAYYVDQVVEFLKDNAGERMGAAKIAEELSLNAPWIRGSLALAFHNEQIQRTRIGRAYVYWHGEADAPVKPPEKPEQTGFDYKRTTPGGDDPG